MDSKKEGTPADCALHREVVKKAHNLVTYINGHKGVHVKFLDAAMAKRSNEEGARMIDSLIEDVVTRWDSELTMLERIYYFDKEILALFGDPSAALPRELALNRFQFDLAYAMTKILAPFRIFTKFVQQKEAVTLAYLPKLVDDLVSSMAPGSFAAVLEDCAENVLAHMETFQLRLIESIRSRFGWMFDGRSLPLAARMFLPGKNLFVFQNFEVTADTLKIVRDNILADYVDLLSPDLSQEEKDIEKNFAGIVFDKCRLELLKSDESANPLVWWPEHPNFTALFEVAKMYLQIPASSGENERSFSSASFTLDPRRTRLDLDNFRKEHRIRRKLCASGNPAEKLQVSNDIIKEFSRIVVGKKEEQ